jgi:V/A-type H+-transporting ATPase subunit D
MDGAATKWRLVELRRTRQVVRLGMDLLDTKREALLRALVERRHATTRTRDALQAPLEAARATLHRAAIEIGRASAEAASLAQPDAGEIRCHDHAILGVHVPRLEGRFVPPRIQYGPGGTCAALDEATFMFAALLPAILDLAEAETAERNLQRGLRRTTRTLNALKNVLLPTLEADIAHVASALEEEERDEAARIRGAMRERDRREIEENRKA